MAVINELKFDDLDYQINSQSLVNVVLLIIKFAYICEGHSCWDRIVNKS